MRSEELLRSTLTELADRPYATEGLYASILKRTDRRPTRRRRTALVLAFAAVVVVLAITLPAFLTQRTVAPADQRVRGNWNLIHTVDLPAGWEVTQALVTAQSESESIHSTDFDCTVTVYGRGIVQPETAKVDQRTPVVVNGTAGFEVVSNFESDLMTGVFWPYAADSWAQVDCHENGKSRLTFEPGMAKALEIAQRVRFAVTTTRLPFELRTLPDGYQVHAVAPPLTSSQSTVLGAVQLTAADRNRPVPYLDLVLSPGQTEIPPGIAGWETTTVRGIPAVLSARDARLCLNLPDHTLCISSDEDTPADLTKSLWAAGRRELLVSVAENLTTAKNLGDQSTWFDANTALPQ